MLNSCCNFDQGMTHCYGQHSFDMTMLPKLITYIQQRMTTLPHSVWKRQKIGESITFLKESNSVWALLKSCKYELPRTQLESAMISKGARKMCEKKKKSLLHSRSQPCTKCKKKDCPVVAQNDDNGQWKSACKKCSINKYTLVVVSRDESLLNLVTWQLKALAKSLFLF